MTNPAWHSTILSEAGLSKADVKAMDLGNYNRKALREIERGRGGKTIYRPALKSEDRP